MADRNRGPRPPEDVQAAAGRVLRRLEGRDGKTIDRGSVGVRGPQAAEELKTLIEIKRAAAGLVTMRATLSTHSAPTGGPRISSAKAAHNKYKALDEDRIIPL